eukprot:CAMPEP_0198284348 /NCGR_PEP_ID=MMETSP1449-20131203/3821_1 /TAXON_ID=420275 /ORGANISM="Attheya septentrionalis, Strain CCMP2084" /LENGTH=686 /DNA_ID=CAMNT_0043981375 /DNA_START=127 /DNA_END=2187 /DNA_ORIENTATION=-
MLRTVQFLILAMCAMMAEARPVVRHIRSAHEFDRLLAKHASETGLPVVVDFYSDGCGPCRMMAPIFKKLAQEVGQDKAVFIKVDTNVLHELSSRYSIRSLPTFGFFLGGKKVNEFSGAGEGQLKQLTQQVIRSSEVENVVLPLEHLVEYYQTHDASKALPSIESVHRKCADMISNPDQECVGAAASQLVRKLKKKYGKGPPTIPRFQTQDRQPNAEQPNEKKQTDQNNNKPKTKTDPGKPNLNLATTEELQAELERRWEEELESRVEEEEDDEAEMDHSFYAGASDFPERVVVVGGGPAGMAAAIYAARAGLSPVVIAPPLGGQLQGKGVDVENYPGMPNVTGPALIAHMRNQAAAYGAVFETQMVTHIDTSQRPIVVHTTTDDFAETNTTNAIWTHTIIVATGAESNWLDIPGEYEMRGGGVSSCATCDGAIYRERDVLVIGGGDTAMEDALVLARTSRKVTVVHRRDQFRASKILAQRVMEHPSISILWNTTLLEILGRRIDVVPGHEGEEEEDIDLDSAAVKHEMKKVVSGAKLKSVETGEETEIECDAVFVAIGHTPATQFMQGVVEFDPERPGYIKTVGDGSTRTSVEGIFAAGDVADSDYRQAITSAGSGAAAALDAERYLSEEGLGNEADEFEAQLLAELLQDDPKSGRSGSDEEETYNIYDDAGGRMTGMKESFSAEL